MVSYQHINFVIVIQVKIKGTIQVKRSPQKQQQLVERMRGQLNLNTVMGIILDQDEVVNILHIFTISCFYMLDLM